MSAPRQREDLLRPVGQADLPALPPSHADRRIVRRAAHHGALQLAHADSAAFLDYYSDNPIRDLPSMLQKADEPVMVLAASKVDRQPDLIERVTPFVDGRRVHLEVVDGSGHFFRDLFDDRALEYAVDFINRLE